MSGDRHTPAAQPVSAARSASAARPASAAPDTRASFAEARERALELLDAPPLLVVSDFDGTLAPIRPEPTAARIEPLGRRALRHLARLAIARPDVLRVMVLSGRGSVDVATRVRVGGLAYLGNHGLESAELARRGRPEALTVEFRPGLGHYRAIVRRLGEQVAERLGRPDWLFVEDKGPSIAFHFRQAPDPDAALAAIDEALRAAEAEPSSHELERFEGRKVIELRPAGVGGKGATMARLLETVRPGSVLVLGDDRTDAEAFAVLASARAAGEVAGLALAVHGAVETPEEVVAAADVVLATPRDAARVLSAVARAADRRLAPGGAPRRRAGVPAP